MSKRTVKRVLVMLDYGPECPDSGEVFDLTALTEEMHKASNAYSSSISLEVYCNKTYKPEPEPQLETSISWGGHAGEYVHGLTHLEDVINSAMKDGERVSAIKAKAKRLRQKAEKLDTDAMLAKLEQVSVIRNQNPIARVTESPLAIQ